MSLLPSVTPSIFANKGLAWRSSWIGPSDLLAVSLGGQVKLFRLPDSRNPELKYVWMASTVQVHKVNSLAVTVTREHVLHIAVGGFTSAGRGCVEIWKHLGGDVSL